MKPTQSDEDPPLLGTVRAPTPKPPTAGRRVGAVLPGLAAAVLLAALATVCGSLVPVIGAPVFAVLGGMMVAFVRRPGRSMHRGIDFAGTSVLQGSIVALGTGLSFHQVLSTGASSLPVLLGTLAAALIGAAVIGRVLSIGRDIRTLIGVGTGICGASAIAATNAVISASEADVSYSMAVIFTCNVVAVVTFPPIGRLLSLSPHAFGLWAGTAINDMSSVVAASTLFRHDTTASAVVVKLTRTLMIIPISIVLAGWRARRVRFGVHPGSSTPRLSTIGQIRHALPVFIGGFLVAVSLNTVGVIPEEWHATLSHIAQGMITTALAGIGLSTRIDAIRRVGLKPLGLGAILWVLVGITSLGLQAATGTLG